MSEQSEHRAYYFGAWNGPGHRKAFPSLFGRFSFELVPA